MRRAAANRAFSVVELLGVLLVLAIIFGLVLPAVRLVQHAAEKRRARAEATALVQAVMRYRHEYGHWPLAELRWGDGANDGAAIVAGIARSDMPGWLSPADKGNIPEDTVGQELLIDALTNAATNPRAIGFIEIPGDGLDKRGRFVDPWRQPYVVIMDPAELTIAGWLVGEVPAVAFSFGPPATGSKGLSNLVFSAEVPR